MRFKSVTRHADQSLSGTPAIAEAYRKRREDGPLGVRAEALIPFALLVAASDLDGRPATMGQILEMNPYYRAKGFLNEIKARNGEVPSYSQLRRNIGILREFGLIASGPSSRDASLRIGPRLDELIAKANQSPGERPPVKTRTMPPRGIEEIPLTPEGLLQRYQVLRQELLHVDDTVLPEVILFLDLEGIKEDRVSSIEEPGTFRLDPELDELKESLVAAHKTLGQRVEDEMNTRMVRWEPFDPEHGLTLHMQQSPYFNSIASELSMDYFIPNRNRTSRDMVEPNREMPRIEESRCTNHIGASGTIITTDDFVVVQGRSTEVAVAAGGLGISAGGAMAWTDTDEHGHCPFETFRREAFNELGINAEELEAIRLLAAVREIRHGGHPGFLLTAKTSLTMEEVKERAQSAKERWEMRKLVENPGQSARHDAFGIRIDDHRALKQIVQDEQENAITRTGIALLLAQRNQAHARKGPRRTTRRVAIR